MDEREKSQGPQAELEKGVLLRLAALAELLKERGPDQPAEAAVAEIFGPIAHCATCGGRIALVEGSQGVYWRHADLAAHAEPHRATTVRSWTPPPSPDWLFLPPEFGELLDKVIEEQDSVPAAQETGESNKDAEH
jgi:hypothetical protein